MFEVIEKIFIDKEKKIKNCLTFEEALKIINTLSRSYKEKIDIISTKDVEYSRKYRFTRFLYHKNTTIILAIKEF